MMFSGYFVVMNSGCISELEKLEFPILSNDFLLPNDVFLTFLLTVGNNVNRTVYKGSHFIPLLKMFSSL